jgi:LmbE family N-acetylglucosaminyl deacetylase
MLLYGKSGTSTLKRPKDRMFKLSLFDKDEEPKVLCLGAHSDDIEIGCGGTILRLTDEVPKCHIHWISFSATENRTKEAQQSADLFLKKAKSKQLDILDFKESYFPFLGATIKDHFEKIKRSYFPDLVFTHFARDAHQDHRLISNLTWNTFRDHLIFEYEIPKYDGDLATPNFYIHLDENIVQRKVDYLTQVFKTQKEKQWFSEETFKSIMRIRGIESNAPSKYAEAFHCRKIVS